MRGEFFLFLSVFLCLALLVAADSEKVPAMRAAVISKVWRIGQSAAAAASSRAYAHTPKRVSSNAVAANGNGHEYSFINAVIAGVGGVIRRTGPVNNSS